MESVAGFITGILSPKNGGHLNVFEFRQNLVDEYSDVTRIKADDIRIYVDAEYDSQKFWPEPLVQANPSFKEGGTVQALTAVYPKTSKLLEMLEKWAVQDDPAQGFDLSDAELDTFAAWPTAPQPVVSPEITPEKIATNDQATLGSGQLLLKIVDESLERHSPQWLMGWRDITNATNERTVIASVVWADDLTAAMPAADPRPAPDHGQPFPWKPERRAHLRAELDAYYARFYGLTRDELRYILDPADVMGPDYTSETFRVLKNNEMREFGEYRTRRLVLAAWDKQYTK